MEPLSPLHHPLDCSSWISSRPSSPIGSVPVSPTRYLVRVTVPARMRFQVLFNPTSGCFSTFLHSTCFLSVFSRYLALEGRYLPLYTAIPCSVTRGYKGRAPVCQNRFVTFYEDQFHGTSNTQDVGSFVSKGYTSACTVACRF